MAAKQPGEGLRTHPLDANPSSVGSADTFSLWEKEGARRDTNPLPEGEGGSEGAG